MFDRSLGMFQPNRFVSAIFSPAELFAAGEQGAWYDPSDFSTMFQDAAGTTPVTGVEQPVGLLLDKSGNLQVAVYGTTTFNSGAGGFGIALSPNQDYLYTSDSSSLNVVRMYARNATTGAITALSPATIASGTGTRYIVLSPDGASAYVTNYTANTISQYSRNASTGQLTALSPATISTGQSPYNIIVAPDGTSVYACNYSSSISAYSRDTSTGALTAIATYGTASNPIYLAISPDGKSVYATCNNNNVSQYSRNTSTGALTALATRDIATGKGPRGIVVTANGNYVYVLNSTDKTLSQYSRNTSTGALTSLGTAYVAAAALISGMMVMTTDNTRLYFCGSGVDVVLRTTLGSNAYQTGSTTRPTLKSGPYRFYFDADPDVLTATFSSPPGNATVAYGVSGNDPVINYPVNISGTTYTLNPTNIGSNLTGLVIINRALTSAETEKLTAYLKSKS